MKKFVLLCTHTTNKLGSSKENNQQKQVPKPSVVCDLKNIIVCKPVFFTLKTKAGTVVIKQNKGGHQSGIMVSKRTTLINL